MTAGSHCAKAKQPFRFGRVAAGIRRAGFTARLRAAPAALAPVGYEDETGFHLGVKTPSFLTDLPRNAKARAGLWVKSSQFRPPSRSSTRHGMETNSNLEDFRPSQTALPAGLVRISREFLAN